MDIQLKTHDNPAPASGSLVEISSAPESSSPRRWRTTELTGFHKGRWAKRWSIEASDGIHEGRRVEMGKSMVLIPEMLWLLWFIGLSSTINMGKLSMCAGTSVGKT